MSARLPQLSSPGEQRRQPQPQLSSPASDVRSTERGKGTQVPITVTVSPACSCSLSLALAGNDKEFYPRLMLTAGKET